MAEYKYKVIGRRFGSYSKNNLVGCTCIAYYYTFTAIAKSLKVTLEKY